MAVVCRPSRPVFNVENVYIDESDPAVGPACSIVGASTDSEEPSALRYKVHYHSVAQVAKGIEVVRCIPTQHVENIKVASGELTIMDILCCESSCCKGHISGLQIGS